MGVFTWRRRRGLWRRGQVLGVVPGRAGWLMTGWGDALGRGVLESSVVGLSRPYCERLNAASRGRACEVPIQWSWRSSFLLTLFAGLGYPLRKLAVRFASVGTGGTASVDLVGDESGQTREAEFASISAGTFHTCGVMVDGFVACWGGDYFGQSTTPAGKFAAVSAAHQHTCGLRADGSVACWGSNEYGQSTKPAGKFASVSAGRGHTCGVRVDGPGCLLGQ